MKYDKTLLAVYLLLFIITTGCTKPEFEPISPEESATGSLYEPVDNSVSSELQDPYAFSNIRKAYENLKISGRVLSEADIRPTHSYIRFMPQNDEELEALRRDSTLILFDHPLNCEQGGETHCDDISCQHPCLCQYCVVPVDKKLPSVRHKILYNVFLPDDEKSTRGSAPGTRRLYEDLEYESARLTGNIKGDEKTEIDSKGSSSGWTPQGSIRVWDDLLGCFIPLAHANVHARWFTHVETALTDSNGYFRMKPFRYKVNYSIKWENSMFTIRNGSFLQAWYNGPKMKGDWNLDIRSGKSLMFATIHRAAVKSFYGKNLGTERPTLRNGGRTKICYIDDNGKGEFWGDWTAGGVLPDIKIWGKSEGVYKCTNKIFGSTIHELAHQAHSQFVGNIKYWKASKIIRESWADAVEWGLSNDEYHELGIKFGNTVAITYNHYFNTHNRWPYVTDRDYSPIFIDLVDQLNQRLIIGKGYPNDMVSGYSLSYLNHNILEKCSDIGSLHAEITLNKVEEVTDYKIDELFYLYN